MTTKKENKKNKRVLIVQSRVLLQRYFEALVTREPAKDLAVSLGIAKQVALCHIFSEMTNEEEITQETKWTLFKSCWLATQGISDLLPIIEPVFFAETIDKPPRKYPLTGNQQINWSHLWGLANYVGAVVEDYARSIAVVRDNASQLKWLQSPKKRQGIFFTPPDLARFIAKRIEQIWDKSWEDTQIFDPSVGTGYFLLAFAEIYAKRFKNLVPEDFQHFLTHNLFGVDQDLAAITATALLVGFAGGDWPVIAAVKKNLCQTDALLMDLHKKYHIVIGNPPWGSIRGASRPIYADKYPMCNDFENFEYFSVLGLDAAISGGIHAFIVPNTFFRNQMSSKFRGWYASRARFLEIHDFSNVPIFSEPKVRSSVFIAQKTPADEHTPAIYIHTGKAIDDIKATYTLPPDWFQANLDQWHLSHIPPAVLKGIYDPILTHSHPLGTYTNTKQGFIPYRFTTLAARLTERLRASIEEGSHAETPLGELLQGVWPACIPPPSIPIATRDTYKTIGQDLARRIVNERLWHRGGTLEEPPPAGYLPLLKGRDVRAFAIHWKGDAFAYGSHVSSYVEERFFTSPRLLLPEITGAHPHQVQAAYTRDTFVHDPQVLNAVFSENLDPRWHWFCLAAANSLPISAFMAISSPKAGKGLFSKLLVQDVKRIPIPLDPSLLDPVQMQLEVFTQSQNLTDLTRIVNGADLPPPIALDAGIRIAMEAARLSAQENGGEKRSQQVLKLHDLNDLLFCRLFGVELNLCLQAAIREI